MLGQLIRYTRKEARRFLLDLLREGDELTLPIRMQVAEDSLDALDQKIEYQGSRLAEWVDCGHHSTDYER